MPYGMKYLGKSVKGGHLFAYDPMLGRLLDASCREDTSGSDKRTVWSGFACNAEMSGVIAVSTVSGTSAGWL